MNPINPTYDVVEYFQILGTSDIYKEDEIIFIFPTNIKIDNDSYVIAKTTHGLVIQKFQDWDDEKQTGLYIGPHGLEISPRETDAHIQEAFDIAMVYIEQAQGNYRFASEAPAAHLNPSAVVMPAVAMPNAEKRLALMEKVYDIYDPYYT
jgi:hypothetical protein